MRVSSTMMNLLAWSSLLQSNSLNEDPKFTELENKIFKLQTVFINLTKLQYDHKVQQLETQLQQKIKEVEELRQRVEQYALTHHARTPTIVPDG